ncbi:transcription factor 20-like [Lytechinus pictus]|uniref:transcription factor 20-like n=1 Tax=Lytechinus pictus TaxID=7653 RepID=UPI0030B9EBB3
MEQQNQYFYNHNQGPSTCMPPQQQQQQQQDPSYPVNNMDQSKMGPMMRALTEDFDIPGQNSASSYPQQGVTNMPPSGDQQRAPSNNFGPASQTLSGYASQYSSGPSSHNYFPHGHSPSPLNSGFSPPGANYPSSGGMSSPYQRQMPATSPLGSPNGHGHPYPRSASAGPTIPSPIMMHGPGMYPHNQTSPGNRSTPFGFPTSPTSPHNHLNHASPPLASPNSMRPVGTLHSPKSLPASSPVPFVSQMSPTASRAQSVPTLPGNSVDHLPPMSHGRSKSPASAGIHRPYPQPSGQQQLYPLPSPKVRPVDQTDSRGQYVELVHTKPGDQRPNSERARNHSGPRKMSDPGHLPRLEEMVAVLSDSKVKETLDEIVSDKNLPVIENGSPGESVKSDSSNQNTEGTKTNRTPVNNGICDNIKHETKGGLSNGLPDSGNKNVDEVNSQSDLLSEKDLETVTPLKKVTKTYCGKVNAKSNGRNGITKQESVESTNSNCDVNESPFKPPLSKQSQPQNSCQTKETNLCKEETVKGKEESTSKSLPETKCQSEPLSKHSPVSEPNKDIASTSSRNTDLDKQVPKTPPSLEKDPMTTPTSKRKSPEGSGNSSGNDSLPLKKRRGRPPGSKNKQEGDDVKPKRKYTRKKKLSMDGGEEEDPNKAKQSKTVTPVKGKSEASAPVVRGPFLRVEGSSVESMVSSKLINSQDAEEEIVKGGKKKQKVVKHTKRHNVVVAGHVGQAAVLSSECPVPTGLWVCTLCGNPPNFGILGDLYGPYYPPGCDVPSSKKDSTSKNDKHRGSDSWESRRGSKGGRQSAGTSRKGSVQESRSQRGKSLMAKQADFSKTRKWRQIKTYMEDMSLTTGRKSLKRRKSESESDFVELWVHEECAVWSQGVIFLQGTLFGIHEASKEAENKKCSLCRDSGASIGCMYKGCKQVYHYLCAVEAECQLHQDNYSMTCPKHKDKKVKMRGGT